MENREDILFALSLDVAFVIFDLDGTEGYDKLVNRMDDIGITILPSYSTYPEDNMLLFVEQDKEEFIDSMSKLNILNMFEAYDWSCFSGECEYVLAKLEPEDYQLLYDVGFTPEQVEEAVEDGVIDLSVLAFQYADANWWSSQRGFIK